MTIEKRNNINIIACLVVIALLMGLCSGQSLDTLTLVDQELIVTDSLNITQSLVIVNSSIILETNNVTLFNCSVTVMGDFRITSTIGPINITINNIITNNSYNNSLNSLILKDISIFILKDSILKDFIVDMSNGTNELWMASNFSILYSSLLPNNSIIFNQGKIIKMYTPIYHIFSLNSIDMLYRPSVQITSTVVNTHIFQSSLPLGIIPNRWSFHNHTICQFAIFNKLELANVTLALGENRMNLSDCKFGLASVDLQGGIIDIGGSTWDTLRQVCEIYNTTVNIIEPGVGITYTQPLDWKTTFGTYGMIYLKSGSHLNFLSTNVTLMIGMYTKYMLPNIVDGLGFYVQFTMATSDDAGIDCGNIHRPQYYKPSPLFPQKFTYLLQRLNTGVPSTNQINGTTICSRQSLSSRYYYLGSAEASSYNDCPDGTIMCYQVGAMCLNVTLGCGVACGNLPPVNSEVVNPVYFSKALYYQEDVQQSGTITADPTTTSSSSSGTSTPTSTSGTSSSSSSSSSTSGTTGASTSTDSSTSSPSSTTSSPPTSGSSTSTNTTDSTSSSTSASSTSGTSTTTNSTTSDSSTSTSGTGSTTATTTSSSSTSGTGATTSSNTTDSSTSSTSGANSTSSDSSTGTTSTNSTTSTTGTGSTTTSSNTTSSSSTGTTSNTTTTSTTGTGSTTTTSNTTSSSSTGSSSNTTITSTTGTTTTTSSTTSSSTTTTSTTGTPTPTPTSTPTSTPYFIKPVCWNGLCVYNITDCIPYPACEVSKPVRCAGICVELGKECPPCAYPCEHYCSETPQVCQPYNGCGLGEYQCPNSLACVPLLNNYTLLNQSCQEYGQQRILNSARNTHFVAPLTPNSNTDIPVWQMDPVEQLLFYSKLQVHLPKGSLPPNASISVVAPFADSLAKKIRFNQLDRFNYYKDVLISPFSILIVNHSGIHFNNSDTVSIVVDGERILPKYNLSDLCLAFVNESTSNWQCTPTPLEVLNGTTTIIGKTSHFTRFTILVQYRETEEEEKKSQQPGNNDASQKISSRTMSIIVGTTVGGIVTAVVVAAFIINYRLKRGKILFAKWAVKKNTYSGRGDGNLVDQQLERYKMKTSSY